MAYDASRGQGIIFIMALVGVLCSTLLILTYYVSSTWKNELMGSKKIILILSIFCLVHNIAYLFVEENKPGWLCGLQASLGQFFGLGSIMLEVEFSLETYNIVNEILINGTDRSLAQAAGLRRFQFYFAFVVGFGIVAVTILVSMKAYKPLDGILFLCYLNNPYLGLIFFLLPLTLCILAMIVIDGMIVNKVKSVVYDLTAVSSQEIRATDKNASFVHAFQRVNPRGKMTIVRLLALPFLYCALGIVILIYNMAVIAGDANVIAIAAAACSLSGALVNAFVWVFTDTLVMWEIWQFVSNGFSREGEDFVGPPSIYGDDLLGLPDRNTHGRDTFGVDLKSTKTSATNPMAIDT